MIFLTCKFLLIVNAHPLRFIYIKSCRCQKMKTGEITMKLPKVPV